MLRRLVGHRLQLLEAASRLTEEGVRVRVRVRDVVRVRVRVGVRVRVRVRG